LFFFSFFFLLFPRFCYSLFHFFLFFFSLFSSSVHFQFYNALFQLHNALSCSFLVVLFIPLQTIASTLSSFLNSVVVRSCAELLFVPLQCYYNSLVFSFHSFFPLCTFNFIVLFFNFMMLFLVPFWRCCSFLCRVIICSSSMLLQFTPLQHYFLSLFDNIVAHYNFVYSFPSMCCGSFYLCCFAPSPTLLFPLVHLVLPLFFPCVGFKSRCNFEVEVLGSTSCNYKCLIQMSSSFLSFILFHYL
jgi:hypothetical protein